MAQSLPTKFFRPAEWERQSAVLMAWPSGANDAYEDSHDLKAATKDVTAIAEAVALFEPVVVMVTPERLDDAQQRFKHTKNVSVVIISYYPKLDLWMRDMAPTFVVNDDSQRAQLYGIDYNFNGWGSKYPTGSNRSLADIILQGRYTPAVRSNIVGEGGSFEVDGEGTVILTESSVIIDNRNPGKGKADIEHELRRTLGAEKIIWIPGRRGLEITDSHIDGLVRFISPGKVLLSRPNNVKEGGVWVDVYHEAYDILSQATDASGRRLQIVEVAEADLYCLGVDRKLLKDIEAEVEDYPSLSYVNYLLVNDGVIFPQFGDKKADKAALKLIQDLYPNRDVEAVYISELPFLGGGIHCSTQEVPVPKD